MDSVPIEGAKVLDAQGGDISLVGGKPIGNVVVHAGRGDPAGNIVFTIPNKDGKPLERLRIDADGGFYVNGRRVATDHDLYEALCDWVRTAVAHG